MKKQTKVLDYRVIVEPDERTGSNLACFLVYCPTLDITSEGDTVEEALANIKEAIELYVETLVASGEDVPVEKSGAIFTSVSITPSDQFGGPKFNFV
jgi:antitoxin HicB